MGKFTVTVRRIYEVTETIEASNEDDALTKVEKLFDELTIEGQEMYEYETSVDSNDQLSLFEDEESREENNNE